MSFIDQSEHPHFSQASFSEALSFTIGTKNHIGHVSEDVWDQCQKMFGAKLRCSVSQEPSMGQE